jgi:rhodanese-related sulfurtransferase
MKYDFAAAKAFFVQKATATTGPHELQAMLDQKADIVVVDVRYPGDFRKSHIPGAVNLPKGKWHKPEGLSKDKLNVLYCYNQQCHLAAEAALQLVEQGYPVVEMEGGFSTWEANGAPVAASSAAVAA